MEAHREAMGAMVVTQADQVVREEMEATEGIPVAQQVAVDTEGMDDETITDYLLLHYF